MNLKTRGFTLIELMVVILIIMLLAGVVVVNVDQARKKARDAQRIAGMNTLATAIQAFYADNHRYPMNIAGGAPEVGQFPESGRVVYPQLVWFLAGSGGSTPMYLSNCPRDPKQNVTGDPCAWDAYGALAHCISSGCPAESFPWGYRYTCWPAEDNNTGLCVHYLMATPLELSGNSTINPGLSGQPEYRIYDGEPCYTDTACKPPYI